MIWNLVFRNLKYGIWKFLKEVDLLFLFLDIVRLLTFTHGSVADVNWSTFAWLTDLCPAKIAYIKSWNLNTGRKWGTTGITFKIVSQQKSVLTKSEEAILKAYDSGSLPPSPTKS